MFKDNENLILTAPGVLLARAKHGLFLLNPQDTFISRSLSLYGEWAESELLLLRKIVKLRGIVLDVGANIGTHTVPFSTWVGPAGRVYAIEPQRRVFQMLCGNLALNGLGNVISLNKAVASKPGVLSIPDMPYEEAYNFGAVKTGSGKAQVEAVKIDSLHLEACNLIKIDVEGAEVEVLLGARETIKKYRPALFVESNDGSANSLGVIHEMGYRAWWHYSAYYNPDNFYGNATNVFEGFAEKNLFCLPRELDVQLKGLPEVQGDDDTWEAAVDRQKR
jgi:FkbM family methyltransferase